MHNQAAVIDFSQQEGRTNEATGVHHVSGRCSGRAPVPGARATKLNCGGRLPDRCRVREGFKASASAVRDELQKGQLVESQERTMNRVLQKITMIVWDASELIKDRVSVIAADPLRGP